MEGLPSEQDRVEKDAFLYEGVDYESFWKKDVQRAIDGIERQILEDFLPAEGRRLVDLGCGFGRLADSYGDRVDQIVFFDGSHSLLKQAFERNGGRGVYIVGDINALPFKDGAFDRVLLVRVYHHLEKGPQCLERIKGLMSDDGVFVFSYHNKRNLRWIYHWLRRKREDNPFSSRPSGFGTTLISSHPKTMHKMLRTMGFSNIRYRGAGLLHTLYAHSGRLGRRLLGDGSGASVVLGKVKLGPWVYCRLEKSTDAKGAATAVKYESVADMLLCPACGGDVEARPAAYRCASCGASYPVRDGIIDFRMPQASPSPVPSADASSPAD